MSKKIRRLVLILALGSLPHLYAASGKSEADLSNQRLLDHAAHAMHEIIQKTIPSVVNINVIKSEEGAVSIPYSPEGRPKDRLDEPIEKRSVGVGTGVVLRSQGIVLTNYHVVENAEKLTVTLNLDDSNELFKKFDAVVVGTDPRSDLALIRIIKPPKSLRPIVFGDSDQTYVGDWVIAIGNPFGLSRSVTFGIVSAKGRDQMGIVDDEDFIQTDAAINPGSSGGPLLNSRGEMIGLNSAIFSGGGGAFMGVGLAIPSKIAKEVAESLLERGRVVRGWVGITAQDLDSSLALYFGVSFPEGERLGALVSNVFEKGPAQRASIRIGDVILQYDGTSIHSASQLKYLVGRSHVGAQIPVHLVRNGTGMNMQLQIQEAPVAAVDRAQTQKAGHLPKPESGIGLAVEKIPEEISDFLHLESENGVLVTQVRLGSPAFEAGLSPGDIILSANKKAIHSPGDLSKFTSHLKEKDTTVLYVQRGPADRVFLSLHGLG